MKWDRGLPPREPWDPPGWLVGLAVVAGLAFLAKVWSTLGTG